MENDFRGPIFLIFHFQISPPIWDMWWVKNFFKKRILSNRYSGATKSQLDISDFCMYYYVKTAVMIK